MMATNEEARAAREAKLDDLHGHLTGVVEQLVTGEDWKRGLEFAARFRARSFRNTLLILAQHIDAFDAGRVSAPEPSYVAGYKQWQSLGRQVELGQPGYVIFAPVTGRFASSTPEDASSWRRLGRFEKPRPGEIARSRMIGAKPAYVWDVSQTTGEPVPEHPSPVLLEGQAPEGMWAGLAALVEAEGFTVLRVEHAGMIRGANGLTDYVNRTVAVRTDMDDAAQVKTLAHELAHVKLHGPDNAGASGHRGIDEVEAESVALMIGAAHGMDTSSYTIPYVSGWARTVKDKDPAEVVQATGERVRKAAGAILDALPTVRRRRPSRPGSRCAPRRMRPAGCARRAATGGAATRPCGGCRGEEAVMRPSELFAQVSGVPLPVAAARSADAGVPVFPCVPGGKRPLIERSFHAATTDAGQVTAWWRRWPAANIGVPTGAPSGLVVVDVDVHGPADGRASFDRAAGAGLVGGWEVLVRTPTGGMHAYYPATPGVEQRSWQAGRAGVDFRGDGGYIIVPPSSRTIDGTTAWYRVAEVGTGAARTVDAKALRDFLDPRPEPRARPVSSHPVGLEDAERLARWLGRQDTDRNCQVSGLVESILVGFRQDE